MALKQIREFQDEQMSRQLQRVNEKALQCERNIAELDTIQQEINHLVAAQEDNINKQVEIATAKIKGYADYLKECIRLNQENRIQGIDAEKSRQQELAQELRETVMNVRTTLQGTPSKSYTCVINRLDDEIKKKLATDVDGFCHNPIEGMQRCTMGAYIGVCSGNIVHVRPCKLELKFELCNFRNASAIAATAHNYLVVSDMGKKVVSIIRKKPSGECERKRNLKLVKLNTTVKPHDVAVTSQGEILVARLTHVEVYSSRGKYGGVIRYGSSAKKDGGTFNKEYQPLCNNDISESVSAHRIAVTDKDTFIIADFNDCTIHTLPGDPNAIIQRHKTTVDPRRLAICSTGFLAIMQKDQINVMNIETGEEVTRFKIPHAIGFCYHKQTDCFFISRHILVDDGWTGVIEQYCAMTGRVVSSLVKGLCDPQDMVVLPDGQLAVADCKTVKIFKIILE